LSAGGHQNGQYGGDQHDARGRSPRHKLATAVEQHLDPLAEV
jgi:hypothetical protein